MRIYLEQLSRGLSKSELAKVEKVAFGINYNYDSYLLINSSYVSHSIYMFITPKGHEPAGDGHKFYPGYGNHITVSMRRTIKHHKKEPCRLTEYTVEVFGADLVSRHNSTGQAEFCHRIVSQKLYVERCGCYNPYLPFPVLNIKSGGPPPICFNMTLFSIHELAENERCMHTLYGEFRNVSHYLSLPEARHCEHFRIMTECNTRTYVIEELYRERMIELWTQSYNDARAAFLRQSFMDTSPDADKIMQLLAKNTTNEQNEYMFARLRQNFGLLTIRRDQAHGILVSEELEYPLSELLSDVGGLMGLWVGISVVGLFEFIELAGLIIVTAYSWLTSNQFNGKQDDVKNQEYCQTWSKDDKGDKQIISIDPQRGQNVVTYKLPDAKLDRPKRRESWNRIHISNKDCGGSRLNEQTTVQKDTETMVWELNLTSRKVEFSYPERQVFWPHKTSYEMTGDKSRSEALVFCPRKIIDHHRNGSNFIEITESSLGQDNLLRRNSSSSLDKLSQDANLLTENKQNKAKQGLNEMS
ncbi:unnamed protein product [Protopolystoma xenopodis]|uniref:Amiloride-sensitive sodium channel n=1 Tax=Protopolystoma xenopodis TaxID=117903 RepID=A0A448XIM1_9PLAT|nr:unnamed protein product [Protopolystoma xenopodis]